MNQIYKYAFAFSLLLLLFNSQAQTIKVQANLPDSTYLIGEYIPLKLILEHSENVEVQWPFLVDTIAGFDIIRSSKIDTLIQDNIAIESQEIVLMKFDSGSYVIPAIAFQFTIDGKKQLAQTQPLPVRINTVAVDTTAAIMPIKPIMEVPWTWKEAMPYIIAATIGLLILLGLLFFFLFYLRKKRKDAYVPPALDPDELAEKRLEVLRQKQLYQNGDIKGYYSELTDILREYIDGRFDIPALEMTTDEIGKTIKKEKSVNKQNYRNLVDLLTISDYVKFAKASPSSKYHPDAFKHAKNFVEFTKVLPDNQNLETTE